MKQLANILANSIGPMRVARLRNYISNFWRCGFAALGRYRPIPKKETSYRVEKHVTFKGDVPLQIADGSFEQGRMTYCHPRPLVEEVDELIVTPSGGTWYGNCFEERYSAGRPGLRILLEKHNAKKTIAEAFIVQCAHNDTYGDWASEYLVPIIRATPISAPLLLPETITSKPFVARDLEKLGIDWQTIDQPIQIKKAHVLRQQKYFVHFPEDDVQVLRRFFGEPIAAARPGSIVYLSRFGERSEVADRQYPSRLIEEIIKMHGGRIIRTNDATLDDYAAAAPDAETVVFDHGSAIYNALGWPVRRMIEIASDTWWNNAFLMLADAANITDYTIIRSSLGDIHMKERLIQTLDAPLDASLMT